MTNDESNGGAFVRAPKKLSKAKKIKKPQVEIEFEMEEERPIRERN